MVDTIGAESKVLYMMALDNWTVQDAKNRFSALVETVLKGRVQRVGRRGKLVVFQTLQIRQSR